MQYLVFNYTDNIYASGQTFTSKSAANKFIKEFRDSFKAQGYYRDNRWNKIAPKDIDLVIIPPAHIFSPFSGWRKTNDKKLLEEIKRYQN